MRGKISFFIILILSSIFLFAILTPKLAIRLFPFLKNRKREDFKNYLLTTKKFDPQVFWQFREFYCPGYFTVKKDGLLEIEKDWLFKKFSSFLKNSRLISPWFAKYHCSSLSSLEGLTDNKFTLDDLLANQEIVGGSVILRKENDFIFFQEKKSGDYYIIFLLDGEKMKKAVGFFDYGEKDVELVKNKKWFNVSFIDF